MRKWLAVYYFTVEAESAEAARRKALDYDTTYEKNVTIIDGKCLGVDDSDLERVGEARKLEEKDNA